jgi:hypothetical protein
MPAAVTRRASDALERLVTAERPSSSAAERDAYVDGVYVEPVMEE